MRKAIVSPWGKTHQIRRGSRFGASSQYAVALDGTYVVLNPQWGWVAVSTQSRAFGVSFREAFGRDVNA
jgi:hypothetical protein